jgi:SAM-dependent methyltransferase
VSIQDVMGAVFKWQASLDTLAALGARLGSPPGAIPPEVASAIDDVLEAAGIPSLDDLTPEQRAMAAGAARTVFGQAADTLTRPERSPGWDYTDAVVLEGQGRASMMVPGLMAQAGPFRDVTSFLDVGTGVGWLVVAAAQIWPNATIVGIDTWEPSLERARNNVAGAGINGRVELRRQSLIELVDRERFDLTWIPSFYIPRDQLPEGFKNVLAATRPGGHMAVGRFDPPPDPLACATQRLRILRDGGSWLEEGELTELLSAAGWSDVRPLPRTAPVPMGFVAGQKA